MLSLAKNTFSLAISLVQLFLGISWFIALFIDRIDKIVPNIHPSVHIFFGIILLFGIFNLFAVLINIMNLIFKYKLKVQSSFSIALLTLVLTIILFFMLRFTLSLSNMGIDLGHAI